MINKKYLVEHREQLLIEESEYWNLISNSLTDYDEDVITFFEDSLRTVNRLLDRLNRRDYDKAFYKVDIHTLCNEYEHIS